MDARSIFALLEEEETLIFCTIGATLLSRRRRRKRDVQEKTKKIQRRFWTRPWLLRRPTYGHYETLMAELAGEDLDGFRNFLRIDSGIFQELLSRVGPRIEKQDTFMRKALSAGLRLAITLRFLATGDSYQSLEYNFRVAKCSICRIVPETCKAIIAELAPEVCCLPSKPAKWMSVSKGFSERWNFHNVIGALDGKHIAVKCPTNAGSVYYNYKGYHSVVLLALVDAEYRFLYVDVGSNGSWSDGGIFSECELRKALEDDTAGIPPPSPLPNDDEPIPFSIVADDAFPLRSWLMKPYPHRLLTDQERLFNYRLSRARRVVENAFGILAHRFRCLLRTLYLTPDRVQSVVLACCVLHNLLRIRFPKLHNNLVDFEDPATHNIIPGIWRGDRELASLDVMRGNNTTKAAKAQRDYLRSYYTSPAGSVPWQEKMI
ncbi:putative nuclease HARBI1 [Lytechinus pictus]|uniref:putative nuclease HARBI1 n=1 Tax=Lytechinus pictus TaxID=7653 RepID=UPI0030B9FA38